MKTSVYIDAANMFYSYKTTRYKIDYKKLYAYFSSQFNLRKISYYTGFDTDNEKQLKFLAKLEKFGFDVIRKPVKLIKTDKNILQKANVDVELAIDAILNMHSYENIILASGDSDFAYLIEVLKNQKKNVIVLSSRGHISKELIKLSDKFITLEELKADLCR